MFAASSAARAADEPEPKALLAQAEAKADAKAKAPAAPNPQSRPIAVRPAPVLADEPRTRDTVLAVSGGLLVVVLAAIGLTITFRSLGADMRGRKRRYRFPCPGGEIGRRKGLDRLSTRLGNGRVNGVKFGETAPPSAPAIPS